MCETKKIEVVAEDGTKVMLVVPCDIPTNERAELLRTIYREHVRRVDPTDHHGATCAIVRATLVQDITDAMEFAGDIVDYTWAVGFGLRVLFSHGYREHGF